MVQKTIVILIIIATVVFTVRGIIRSIKGKSNCNCRCGHCPYNNRVGCHCHNDNYNSD
ncbi:MAG: FeoB-associated Cys-rich membrane protein [Bacteroidales bacterium]|nr:FeoB-associated Cys-rich membrane protein [Bacteroidales bacterium]